MRALQPKHKYVLAKNVQGHKMILKLEESRSNPYPNSLWMNGVYEVNTTQYIKDFVKEGDVVLDIGSNFGYFTLLLAKQVGPTGVVHSFEAHPELFKILKKNVELNGYNNIKLYNVAVSNFVGRGRFYLNSIWAGTSSIFPHRHIKEAVIVKFISIDSLDLERTSFAKIDVEGAEALVLDGMRNTISKNADMSLIIEFLPTNVGFDADAIFDIIDGFETKNVDGNLLCKRVKNCDG